VHVLASVSAAAAEVDAAVAPFVEEFEVAS